MGITTLERPITIGNSDNNPVKYIFTLSAVDQKSHINAMAELVTLLENQEFYRVLAEAKDKQEIIQWIQAELMQLKN